MTSLVAEQINMREDKYYKYENQWKTFFKFQFDFMCIIN